MIFLFFFLRKKSDEVARKGLAFQLFLQIKLPSGSEAPPPTPASPEQGKQSRATLCQHLRRVHSKTPHAQGQGCGQDCVFTVQLGKTPCQGCARTELCPPGRLPRQTPCEHPQHPPNTRPAGKERHSVGAQEHPHPLREQSSAQASNRPLLSPGLTLSLLPCSPGAFFLLLPWGAERKGGEQAGSLRGAQGRRLHCLLPPSWPSAPSLVAGIQGGLSKGPGIHSETHVRPLTRPGGPLRVQVTDHVPSFRPRT